MKKAHTATDSKGNIYIVPGQMTREEAEAYFPVRPERDKKEFEMRRGLTSLPSLPKDLEKWLVDEWKRDTLG